MIGDRSLKGKTIAVLVADAYEDMELWYPVFRLREENAKVWLVGPQGGQTYSSKHGYPARSDQAAMDAVVGEFDAVIIPGGMLRTECAATRQWSGSSGMRCAKEKSWPRFATERPCSARQAILPVDA